jgi:hypothetical protein
MHYFVDYSDSDAPNPNWAKNNNGKWWEPTFDVKKAGWKEGELGVGYDTENKIDWINTPVDPKELKSIMGRIDFPVASKDAFTKLILEKDIAGKIKIWLNGEIVHNEAISTSVDISMHKHLLHDGINTLTYINTPASESDTALGASLRLSLTK